jgi:branched-chain amino acid transport system permease protein
LRKSWKWFWGVVIGAPIWPSSRGACGTTSAVLVTLLNGLTLASFHRRGRSRRFGLMRNVNLRTVVSFGGYLGFFTAQYTGSWLLALAAGFLGAALVGLVIQVSIFRFMQGDDLRQTLVTIGLSIVIADILLWGFGATVHQIDAPAWLSGPLRDIPLLKAYSKYRLMLLPIGIAIGVALWLFLNRTRVGMMIRAGVDDRAMLSASGVNVNVLFAVTFAIGAGLAGFGGVIGAVELSMVPGRTCGCCSPRCGGDRRRDGQRGGRSARRHHSRRGRDLRPRLRADLQRRVHVRDPGAGARVSAARHPGTTGMSARTGATQGSGRGRAALLPRAAVFPAAARLTWEQWRAPCDVLLLSGAYLPVFATPFSRSRSAPRR